jgi:hypothetical protein
VATNEELQEQINKLVSEFEEFKMFTQRKSQENLRTLKTYSGETTQNFELLQDQMNERFELANTHLEDITGKLQDLNVTQSMILDLLRMGVNNTEKPSGESQ